MKSKKKFFIKKNDYKEQKNFTFAEKAESSQDMRGEKQ